jgi:multimeric flavodoxin WrbA
MMNRNLSRRMLLGTSGAAMAGGVAACAAPGAAVAGGGGTKIIGISCSLRKGRTTATALQASLDAAREVDPRVAVELVDIADMNIPVSLLVGKPLPKGQTDDFPKVADTLSDPRVGGMIVGTPVYFGSMTSLCKAFLERLMVFRKNDFALRGKVAGVLAVGGARTGGGHERAIQCIQAALMSQDLVIVGDGKPTAHTGASLWNHWKDDIAKDEAGMATAKNLGRRVAGMALHLAGAPKPS